MEHRSLEGHVIRVAKATDDLHCQLLCSIEGACSSFNLGPGLGGEHICELSNSDHSQHPENLGNRAGFAYRYAVTVSRRLAHAAGDTPIQFGDTLINNLSICC